MVQRPTNKLLNAERIIKDAAKEKAIYVNLQHLSLGELPESLRQLTWLEGLILTGNRLKSLPEWLDQMTKLQSLDIGFNQLTEFATLAESPYGTTTTFR